MLIEAGYRCAVPTCRTILAIDLHHIVEVSEGGSNDPANLVALCPTCHGLYHRGTIPRTAVRAWKSLLVSLSSAFDRESVDLLLFLRHESASSLVVSGDGVLRFARLVSAGLATFRSETIGSYTAPQFVYAVRLTPRGQALADAWISGDAETIEHALVPPGP
ncbi:MAG: HNH endonuclease [Myxococcales bacterium]|nr:HNH endonuclease [Myxococcales bacterium]